MASKKTVEFLRTESSHYCAFNTSENITDFRFSQFYLNYTDTLAKVIHRNNFIVEVKPDVASYSDNFVIRTIYHFNGKETIVGTINMLKALIANSKLQMNDLEILHSALFEAYRTSNGNIHNYEVVLDKVIPGKRVRLNQATYVHEADVVICDATASSKIVHPFSEQGVSERGVIDFAENKKVSGVFVELIDNDNKINTRYMYVAKKLVEVPAQRDTHRNSGVYCTRIDYDRYDAEVASEYYTFDEAEKAVGLFRTEEDAMSGGDPEALTRIAEDTARRELAAFRIKAEREKAESEARLRALQDELDARRLARSDHYDDRKHVRADVFEERSHYRKDSSEAWKFLTGAFVAGLTVYAATAKMNNKKS